MHYPHVEKEATAIIEDVRNGNPFSAVILHYAVCNPMFFSDSNHKNRLDCDI